ncbi:hypothetical protein PQ455_01535 [Sphingomonas naphthae]|uniref:Uncharacterized protein n=1 Tax=Sphingomonas naphthae TaxID=1813468 RepID=A0ABY7TL41_9SPHN|nr:hypothetical protein [Sphingomonas naphthae]WCT73942.1 hypothetical protein PQ455_01535 [Sphingomonas naphthae]
MAARYAADPAAVARYQARQGRLADAMRRQRQRVDERVMGYRPDPPKLGSKPAGMSKAEWKVEKARLRSEAMKGSRFTGFAGTPETLEKAQGTHSDALVQMKANGTIDADQLEWAAEIANVHRSIESDVAVSVASLEARVDNGGGNRNRVGESIRRIRLHMAYGQWREQLPMPRQLVLDMIVGDAIGYSVAAKRHGVHHRRARRLLIEALNRWPACVDRVYRLWSDDEIAASRDAA